MEEFDGEFSLKFGERTFKYETIELAVDCYILILTNDLSGKYDEVDSALLYDSSSLGRWSMKAH